MKKPKLQPTDAPTMVAALAMYFLIIVIMALSEDGLPLLAVPGMAGIISVTAIIAILINRWVRKNFIDRK